MEFPYITLCTKGRDDFLCSDGYRGVSDAELEVLLPKSREFVPLLETERENRRSVSHQGRAGRVVHIVDRSYHRQLGDRRLLGAGQAQHRYNKTISQANNFEDGDGRM